MSPLALIADLLSRLHRGVGAALAEATPWWDENAGRVFENPFDTTRMFSARTLLLLVLVPTALVGVVALLRWLRSRPLDASGTWLFLQLAAELHLSMGDRWMLWRVARQQRLPSAITLLLSPATLRHHAAAYAATLGPAGRDHVLRRVRRLRAELFDT